MAYEPKPLPFEKGSLKGISEKTIEIHYEKLYKGYVNKYNEIQEKLGSVDKEKANQTYSELRGLKDGESFAEDGIILHEMYFENLGGEGFEEEAEVAKKITSQFGSSAKFREELTAAGMAARGWVIAGIDPLDKDIHIYIADAHNQGGIWGAIPLIVLDVYEHAYFIDFGGDRKAYLEVFCQNIKCEKVNERYLNAIKK